MSHFDILMERLKLYDEVTILELLDLTTVDILEQFAERVWERRKYLQREVELLVVEDEDSDGFEEDLDGFEIQRTEFFDGEENDE